VVWPKLHFPGFRKALLLLASVPMIWTTILGLKPLNSRDRE